eukprot:Partr_v1_DN24893_c0_g1_i2_m29522 putative PIH1 domain containing
MEIDDAALEAFMKSLTPAQLAEFTRQASAPNFPSTPEAASTEILPSPGFVVKSHCLESTTKCQQGDKLFINMCHSPSIPMPVPPDASDDMVAEAMQGIDNGYRVPLSLSGCRLDVDKAGRSCLVTDACVNTRVLERCRTDARFRAFMIHMALSWVEQRHGLLVSRDYSLPKMRAKGELLERHVIVSRPEIIGSSTPDAVKEKTPKQKLVEMSQVREPRYQLLTEPPHSSRPDYIICTVFLDDGDIAELGEGDEDKLSLTLHPHRLVFEVEDMCKLDIPLPSLVDIASAGSQFDRSLCQLTVTMECAH